MSAPTVRRAARAFPLTTICALSWMCLAAASAAGGALPAFLAVALVPAYVSALAVQVVGLAVAGGSEPMWLTTLAIPLAFLPPLAGDLALRALVWREPHRRSVLHRASRRA